MNLDHDFVQGSKLCEDHKKKVFTKNGTLFSPNSGEDQKKQNKKVFTKKGTLFSPEFTVSGRLRSDAHQCQIIGGDADIHHTVLKLLGGIQPNYCGRYIPPSPPGFGTSVGNERLLQLAYC